MGRLIMAEAKCFLDPQTGAEVIVHEKKNESTNDAEERVRAVHNATDAPPCDKNDAGA